MEPITQMVDVIQIRCPVDRTRYYMPADLAHLVIHQDISSVEAVGRWMSRSNSEVDQLLAEIHELADSIVAVGLINPIVVTEENLLVSGLGRVLAHALLVVRGQPEFANIRAIVLDRSWSLAQQVAETVARQGFTAVEMAINLALMVAKEEGYTVDAQGIFTGEAGTICVPDELRTVASGRRKHGTWTAVTDALGRTYRHWTNYLKLLNLCDEALTLAHRAGLAEWALRKVAVGGLSCEDQIQAVRGLMNRGRVDAEEEKKEKRRASRATRAIQSTMQACSYLAALNPDAFDVALADVLARCRDWDEFEDIYEAVERVYRGLYTLHDRRFGQSGG